MSNNTIISGKKSPFNGGYTLHNTKNVCVESREIHYIAGSDRHILIFKKDGAVTGLNFCQGNDINYFKSHFHNPDVTLTYFYNCIESLLLKNEDQVKSIDKVIDAYFEFSNHITNF